MNSLYGLNYEIVNLNNLERTCKIRKDAFKDNLDYNDLDDKAVNTIDDNCFF